jgi:DNA-binding HxlR family transcriptional regulator
MNPHDDILCVESIKKIMSIFGGKWTFVIIGELRNGNKRFNELNRAIGISTKSLSDALKNLEANGVLERTVVPTTPISVQYSLTEKGKDFEQVFLAMRDWGTKWLGDGMNQL